MEVKIVFKGLFAGDFSEDNVLISLETLLLQKSAKIPGTSKSGRSGSFLLRLRPNRGFDILNISLQERSKSESSFKEWVRLVYRTLFVYMLQASVVTSV